MPSISKIRLTNIVYEEGNKRYNDELFLFDGHNGAILLENGGGKTVLIQTALQAIIPHVDLADRKMKKTLELENAPAHIAIEWITNDQPRRYVVTAVSLFTTNQGLDSLRYVYEYDANDPNDIEGIPFVKEGKGKKRTAEIGEMQDYYAHMRDKSISAQTFNTIKAYQSFIEEQYHIIAGEWDSIVKINSTEGGVEAFFDTCKSTNQLFDRLLIPTVENAIVGHDATIFADMFEQHHASFKNYKKLKETIEENEKIETQLANYVTTYEKLHNRVLDYQTIKQKVKGTWNQTKEQQRKAETEQQILEEKFQKWQSDNQGHLVKKASYAIFSEETRYKGLEADYKAVLANKIEQDENVQQYNKDYYSLKLAELERDRKEKVENLTHIKTEIARFDQTEEMEVYQDQLEVEKQILLGWYQTEIEKLTKDKRDQNYQLNPLVEQINRLKSQKKDGLKNEQDLRDILSKIKAIIASRQKDIKKIEQQILSNPDQESVSESFIKWQNRSQFLDEEVIRLLAVEKELSKNLTQASERKEEYKKVHAQVETDKNKLVYQLDEMDKNQQKLIEKLALIRPQWAEVDIYLTQVSIVKRLTESIDKHKKERNVLLAKERISYRFVDDHGNQQRFFGDAFLEEQLSSWKNQFDYLVTGVEYLQLISETEKARLLGYPLWAITLVTTNKEKAKVIEKVRHVATQLQFPIIVRTTEEALDMDKGVTNASWIAPNHWVENVVPESFLNWKQALEQRAREITGHREDKEAEITRWEDCLKALNQFIQAFPYQFVKDLEAQLSACKNNLEELTLKLEKEQRFIEEHQLKIKQNKDVIDNHREERQGIDGKIEKAQQYLTFEKEVKVERVKEKDASERLNQLVRQLNRLENQLTGLEDEKQLIVDRVASLDARLELMIHDELYIGLQEYTPEYTDDGKKVIQDRITNLEMKIRAITVSQGEWLAKQEAVIAAIKVLEKQLKEVRQEHTYLDENVIFPSDGNSLMATLWKQIVDMQSDLEKMIVEVAEKKAVLDEQKGKWRSKVDQFSSTFPDADIVTFENSSDQILAELQSEAEKMIQRKAYLDQESERINKEVRAIANAISDLNRFEEAHHFTAPDIDALLLTSEELLDYSYHRNRFITELTGELRTNKNKVSNEEKIVEQAKVKFRTFCSNRISNIKLQQMAINGVENKRTYPDIVAFKQNMLTSIKRGTQYANEHIRKSDEDLQLFINQIHSHLQKLVEELKQIPKKTKVKVNDEWKQIFTFVIPEWEEEVGKSRIRDHIEWILQQLDKNELGIQDEGKVRKQIEMWLQSKQLMQIVMNNEAMKVSCRKVTNDIQVTTRPYTWEQSNLWSGGEKWSKNMTLFLGILNYVAEKKKHIHSTMKRHRTVILDNPFGKASSDHVLNPVFFVAEQLGFQIIALTAHAEGKFLQDYFPVIYSCRLRQSTDSSKKVMTKEKWLHHAYFQDHDPKTIDRLGEIEQMALFE